ncbi:unnamed protein product [Vicia faba]|uniref:Uncharacterized protein n=1 Tax=Vicia faba TaxID=3906 RepID=A0AAV0YR04_VICFA|nr:unnamed protein product [Vicia faba]
MILRYAKVKEHGKFPVVVKNTYNVTKLQINKDITDINEFVKSIGKSLTTTSCNNRGWSQKSSSSHMSIREKFLDKYIQIKLNEISQLAEATFCVIVATTDKLLASEHETSIFLSGWTPYRSKNLEV